MTGTPCPSHDELVDYLAERLAEDATTRIRSHLDTCSECRSSLETLRHTRRPPSMSAADYSTIETLGEYQLVEKIGAGGMGTVYKAWHTELGRMVALKVLSEEQMQDDRAVARFRREMKAVGRFDHPNIVRAYDAREIEGTYFLVMEYIDGMDLAELVARSGPLPVADACELVRQAACGLECAEQHGLVHRDIKPSNLIMSANGKLKILDLGLARIHSMEPVAATMTAVGQLMGTPDFMAPEQVGDSHAVDIRADVYSLGCTLYMLLAGHPPFVGSRYGTAFEKMVAHTRDPIPPIRHIRPDIPKQLAEILDQALAKSPDERPATPGLLADALRPFAEGANPAALLAQARRQAGNNECVNTAAVATTTGSSATTEPTRGLSIQPTVPTMSRCAGRPVLLAVSLLVVLALTAGFVITNLRHNSEHKDNVATANVKQDDAASRTAQDKEQADADQHSTARPAINPSELPGWIVMSWTRRGLGMPSLWLISPDGRRRVPVTRSRDRLDIQPIISPDARRIAFIRGKGPKGSTSLWMCNVDGSKLREVVQAQNKDERLVSPVWISDSLIFYTRYSQPQKTPHMEVWQIDLADGTTRRVFDFSQKYGLGLVTDISPDGQQLLVTSQTRGIAPKSHVCLTDLEGSLLHAIWTDTASEQKNIRAIWSPRDLVAWCHYYTADSAEPAARCCVVLAKQNAAGHWNTKMQTQQDTFTTPLAWSPDGRYLLCAHIVKSDSVLTPATLVLMDDQLQPAGELFELKSTTWGPRSRDFGRLADWAMIPEDALPEKVL